MPNPVTPDPPKYDPMIRFRQWAPKVANDKPIGYLGQYIKGHRNMIYKNNNDNK